MKSFSTLLARLEALEATQRPTAPPYVCMHADDFATIIDSATPQALCQAIADAYHLTSEAKLFVGMCDGCEAGERCRVCSDRPFVGEL